MRGGGHPYPRPPRAWGPTLRRVGALALALVTLGSLGAESCSADGAARAKRPRTASPDRIIVELAHANADPLLDAHADGLTVARRRLLGDMQLLFTRQPSELYEHLSQPSLQTKYGIADVHWSQRGAASAIEELEREIAAEDEREPLRTEERQLEVPWHLEEIGQGRALSPLGRRPRSAVVVAVVDSGVDYTHPALRPAMWRNESFWDGVNDDGNDFTDDLFGVNFLMRDPIGDPSGDVMDPIPGHGTKVAGLIAGRAHEQRHSLGVCERAQIMALCVGTRETELDEDDGDILEAWTYAADHGARIVVCAFGKSHASPALKRGLEALGSRGILVVVAARPASWDREKCFPAEYGGDGLDNLLVVGPYAQGTPPGAFEAQVNLLAPGADMLVPVTRGDDPRHEQPTYESHKGSSFAAAVVAGVAAELLSHYPQLTATQLRKILLESAERSVRRNGPPKVRLDRALAEAAQRCGG